MFVNLRVIGEDLHVNKDFVFCEKNKNITFLTRIVFFTPYRGKVNDIIIILGHFLLLEHKSKGHLRRMTHEQGKLRKRFGQIFA